MIKQKASSGRASQLPFCFGRDPGITEHQSWFGPQMLLLGSEPSAGYLGPLFSPGVKGVSDGPLLGVLHAPPDKLGVDWLLHEHPGGSRATLALIEENSLMGALHCQVHWREGGGKEVVKSFGQDWQQLHPRPMPENRPRMAAFQKLILFPAFSKQRG